MRIIKGGEGGTYSRSSGVWDTKLGYEQVFSSAQISIWFLFLLR